MSAKCISPLVLFGQCRYTTNHRKNSFYVQLWYCIATLFAPPQSKLCHEMLCLLNGFKAKSKDLLCIFNICTNICAHRPNIYKQCMHRFWIINTVSWINRYHVSGLGTCEKKKVYWPSALGIWNPSQTRWHWYSQPPLRCPWFSGAPSRGPHWTSRDVPLELTADPSPAQINV